MGDVSSRAEIQLAMTGTAAVLSGFGSIQGAVLKTHTTMVRINQAMFQVGSGLGSLAGLSGQMSVELQQMTTSAIAASTAMATLSQAMSTAATSSSFLLAALGVTTYIALKESFGLMMDWLSQKKSVQDLAAANEQFANSLTKVIEARKAAGSLPAATADELLGIVSKAGHAPREAAGEAAKNLQDVAKLLGATADLKQRLAHMDVVAEGERLQESKIKTGFFGQIPSATDIAALRTSLAIQEDILREREKIIAQAVKEKASLSKPGVPISDDEAAKLRNEIDAERLSLKERGLQLSDPNSLRETMGQTFRELQKQWGTLQQQISDGFVNVIGGAINTISEQITKLILYTGNWGEALRNIGVSILESVIQSIIKMAVQWVVSQAFMAIAGKAIQAAVVAAQAPFAAATAAIWAVPATLATIASYGGAAAAAPAAIAAAEGITLAQSLAAFASGGYTGTGPRGGVAGLVHNEEFVVNAATVDRVGLESLEAMQAGAEPRNSPSVTVQMLFDKAEFQREMMRSGAFEDMFVDTASKTIYRWRR